MNLPRWAPFGAMFSTSGRALPLRGAIKLAVGGAALAVAAVVVRRLLKRRTVTVVAPARTEVPWGVD